MRPLAFCFALLVLLAAGCSAITNTGRLPDPGSGPGRDAGTGGPDSSTGRDASVDAGVGVDASERVDSGVSCTPGSSSCEVDVLVECSGGGDERRTDCAEGGDICSGTPAECRDPLCDPGSRECNEARTGVLICDARGASMTETPCPYGCDPETNMCGPDTPACPGVDELTPGSHRFNTCGESNDESHVRGGTCGDTRANGRDLMFRITLARDTDVFLDLRDDDSMRSIDTILYIRRVCDEPSSQVECSDDVRCSESDIMSGCTSSGYQVRQSRIRMRLSAGTYYVIVDSFDYGTGGGGGFSCGNVRLVYSTSLSTGST